MKMKASAFCLIVIFVSFCDSFAASISVQKDLDFGIVTAPTSGNGRITVKPNNNVTTNSKTTLIGGSPNRGEYTLTVDDANTQVSFDIVNITTPSNVTLDNMKVKFKGTTYKWDVFPTPYVTVGSLSEDVYVAGRMKFTNNAADGVNNFQFDLIVTEQ